MSKIVALTPRECQIINELLGRVAPCAMKCDPSYGEFDTLRGKINIDPYTPTHKHIKRSLTVRYIAEVQEVGCDRPMILLEGECGAYYVRAAGDFTERFHPIS